MKSSHVFVLFMMSILIIGGLAFYVISNPSASKATTTLLQNQNSATCNLGGTTQTLLLSGQYWNITNKQTQYLGSISGGVWQPSTTGSGWQIAKFNSWTSGSTPTSVSNINCNTNYLVSSGNNIYSFVNFTTVNTGVGANPTGIVTLARYTAPTLYFNTAGSTATNTIAVVHSVTASSAQTAQIFIKAGGYFDSQGPGLLIFTYNSLSETGQPSIAGLTPASTGIYAVPTLTTSNSVASWLIGQGAQNAYVAYSIPQGFNGQFSTPTGAAATQQSITVSFQMSGTYGANEIVSAYWVPGTGYFNTQTGQPSMTAYENMTTQASLISATGTVDAIVLQTN